MRKKILLTVILLIFTNLLAWDIPANAKFSIKNDLVYPAYSKESLGKASSYRPDDLLETYLTSEGNFKIHYTLSGNDAVSATITNQEGVPDWVFETGMAAERVYSILMDSLGFSPPPPDQNIAGPELDIYIKNWGGAQYALTYPENAVTSTSRPYDWTSFLVIDNDYVENAYFTNGIDALRVTIAHEFFHMVQLGYNWQENNGLPGITASDGDRYFLEWCAVWFEEYAYPQVNDYYGYMSNFFSNPTQSIWSTLYHYSLPIFVGYILDNYGTELLSQVWEKIKKEYAFQALQQVLDEERDVKLSKVWNDFCQSSYFTGSRYDEDYALSADAMDFPLLQIPSGNSSYFTDPLELIDDLRPFSTVPFKILFENEYFVSLKQNQNFHDTFLGSYIVSSNLREIQLGNFNLSADTYIAKMTDQEKLFLFVTNPSISAGNIELNITLSTDPKIPVKIFSQYPNPVILKTADNISFELQIDKREDYFDFYLYDLLGREVMKKTYDINSVAEDDYVYRIPASEIRQYIISSGIYIARIKEGKKEVTQTLTILK